MGMTLKKGGGDWQPHCRLWPQDISEMRNIQDLDLFYVLNLCFHKLPRLSSTVLGVEQCRTKSDKVGQSRTRSDKVGQSRTKSG